MTAVASAVFLCSCLLAFWDVFAAYKRYALKESAVEQIEETPESVVFEFPDTDLYSVSGETGQAKDLLSVLSDAGEYSGKYAELKCIGMLEIPSLDIYEPIWEGASELTLRYGLGHFDLSSEIFDPRGNFSVMGHRYAYGNEAFTRLPQIETGDSVWLTQTGFEISQKKYVVVRKDFVTPEELPEILSAGAQTAETLTLTTCVRENGDKWRMVVTCRPAEKNTPAVVVSKIEKHDSNRGDYAQNSGFDLSLFDMGPVAFFALCSVLLFFVLLLGKGCFRIVKKKVLRRKIRA